MEVLQSFHGKHGGRYLVLRSRYFHHDGELGPRSTLAGEFVSFNESVPISDIVDAVVFGHIVPELPEKFLCKVRKHLAVRVEEGALVSAKVGETVEVLGTPETARLIALRMIVPISSEVWSPYALTPAGRLYAITNEPRLKSDFIKLPADIKVDSALEDKSGIRVDHLGKAHRK